MEGRSSIRWSGARLNHDRVDAGEALCWSVLFRLGLKGLDGIPRLMRIVPAGSGTLLDLQMLDLQMLDRPCDLNPPLMQFIRREVLEVGHHLQDAQMPLLLWLVS